MKCFRCRKEIDHDNNEVYYVFIGKTKTENADFCSKCWDEDIKAMRKLDPFLVNIYEKNFIKMNE